MKSSDRRSIARLSQKRLTAVAPEAAAIMGFTVADIVAGAHAEVDVYRTEHQCAHNALTNALTALDDARSALDAEVIETHIAAIERAANDVRVALSAATTAKNALMAAERRAIALADAISD